MSKMESIFEKALEKYLLGDSEIKNTSKSIDDFYIGKYCIIRTYSAGVFAGVILKKSGDEVIVDNCRRLWYWKTKTGISLSDVAIYGLNNESKLCEETNSHWLSQIELILCTKEAENDIREKSVYKK